MWLYAIFRNFKDIHNKFFVKVHLIRMVHTRAFGVFFCSIKSTLVLQMSTISFPSLAAQKYFLQPCDCSPL